MRTKAMLAALSILIVASGCRLLGRTGGGSWEPDDSWEQACGSGESGGGEVDLPAAGGVAVLDGSLGWSDSLWSRPTGGCTAASGDGDYLADGWVVRNSWALEATVTIDVVGASLGDTMVFLYEGAEFPTDPQACLDGDDDSGDGLNASLTAVLEPGGSYFVVVTAYSDAGSDSGCGTYQLQLSTHSG
jgi:hypothetical protein